MARQKKTLVPPLSLKPCILECKNRIPTSKISEIRNLYNTLVNKKIYIKNCIIFKPNNNLKKKKKYKRNMTYRCYYYLFLSTQAFRVCQRCFMAILGLTHYNVSNIIKESVFLSNNV